MRWVVLFFVLVFAHLPTRSWSKPYELIPFSSNNAYLRQAESLLQQRSYTASAELLEKAAASANADSERQIIRYLLAQTLAQAGKRQSAVDVYRSLTEFPPLAHIAMVRLGRLHEEMGQVKEALAAYQDVHPESAQYVQSRLLRSRLLLQQKQYAEAAEAAQDAWNHAISDEDRSEARLLLADIAVSDKRREEAVQLLQTIWWENDEGASAALERLDKLGASPDAVDDLLRHVDTLNRFNVKRRSKDVQKQLTGLKKKASAALVAYVTASLQMHDRDQRDQAPATMTTALNKVAKDSQLRPWVLIGMAEALRRVDRDLEAVDYYIKFTEEFPDHRLVPRALLGAGDLLYYRAFPMEATVVLTRLVEQYPLSQERADALWELGWAAYLSGNLERAVGHFGALAASYPTRLNQADCFWSEQALYWKGRAEQRAGRHDLAAMTFADVARRFPLTYYGVLATHRLLEAERPELVPAHAPLDWDGSQPSAELSVDVLTVEQTPALDAAVLLYRAGLLQEADRELRDGLVRGWLPPDGVLFAAAIRGLRAVGGTAAVLRRYGRFGGYPTDLTVGAWRSAFPVQFLDIARECADENGCSPYLILGVIRHESSFNPRVISHANAVGLMQLLPSVARSVATELLDMPAPTVSGLKNPEMNLKVGSRFLRELFSMYRGNAALALASYNAGPYAVQDWLHHVGHMDTDEFVETIPFKLTSAYVKEVLTSAAVYTALYAAGDPLEDLRDYLPRRLPVEIGPFMEKSASGGARSSPSDPN